MHGTLPPKRSVTSWQRLALSCFWAAFLFTFVMATLPHPPAIVETGDKVKHMLAFATLTALGLVAWPRRYVWIATSLLFYGAMIEWVQAIPVLHRDSDIRDWFADALAIGMVIAIFAVLERFWPRWQTARVPAVTKRRRR